MWFLAAMPLWVSGFFFLYMAFYCPCHRRPDETDVDLIAQFVIALLVSLLLLYLAAKMSS
jgi:hypothetical protein